MLDFMGTWLHAQQDALTVTKTASVIKKCVNLVTSPSRQLRSAVVALLPAIAAPAKVIHIYKPDTSVASAVNVKDSEVLLLKVSTRCLYSLQKVSICLTTQPWQFVEITSKGLIYSCRISEASLKPPNTTTHLMCRNPLWHALLNLQYQHRHEKRSG